MDAIEKVKLEEGLRSERSKDVKDVIGGKVLGHYYTNPEHPIFAGHFPGNPILPGVIQIEMMAQVSSFTFVEVFPHWRDLKKWKQCCLVFNQVNLESQFIPI